MRYIKKTKEPVAFTKWKSKKNNISYSKLFGPTKKILVDSLLSEQGHICCYCEGKLDVDDYHIEHLNPQCRRSGDDLDYANLLCSCLKNTCEGEPLHCGKKKKEALLPVHPLQTDCQRKFTYTAYGEIDGIDQAARDTIRILGLNIPKLVSLRRQVLDMFLDGAISDEDAITFVKGYLEKSEGKYNPFISAVEFVFGKSISGVF